jgi:hypothetical protein
MEHDAWFFLGIFVFIFIVWIASGGPLHTISFGSVALPESTSTAAGSGSVGGGSYLHLPEAPGIGGKTTPCLLGSTICPNAGFPSSPSESGGSGTQTSNSDTPVPSGVPGVTFTPPSPYRNVVSFSDYVDNASSSNPDNEYVEIHVSQNASGPIDITNWILLSGATGNSAIIPQGTTVPTSGIVNATQDILLNPGDSAIIISGESPVGASFRENECTGYFNNYQTFTPSLPDNCPEASAELESYYGTPYIHDPSCIAYTDSLERCQEALPSASSDLSLTCQSFLESHLDYNGCLAYHQSDPDFNGTTWYIYLGRKTTPLWRTKYEVVELLDSEGKTVASFNY